MCQWNKSQVSDVKLNDILSPEMTLALQKHRTQFTFEDGKISDICTHPGEALAI